MHLKFLQSWPINYPCFTGWCNLFSTTRGGSKASWWACLLGLPRWTQASLAFKVWNSLLRTKHIHRNDLCYLVVWGFYGGYLWLMALRIWSLAKHLFTDSLFEIQQTHSTAGGRKRKAGSSALILPRRPRQMLSYTSMVFLLSYKEKLAVMSQESCRGQGKRTKSQKGKEEGRRGGSEGEVCKGVSTPYRCFPLTSSTPGCLFFF